MHALSFPRRFVIFLLKKSDWYAKISFVSCEPQETVYPGVAQLVGRLVWDQDAASSSLATRTK